MGLLGNSKLLPPQVEKASLKPFIFDGWVLIFLVMLVVVRLVVLFSFQEQHLFDDEGEYISYAYNIANDFKAANAANNWRLALFKAFYWKGSSLRAPLYPYFMGIHCLLWGDFFRIAVQYSQIFISLLTALLIYYLGLLVWDRPSALFSLFIFALYPDTNLHSR